MRVRLAGALALAAALSLVVVSSVFAADPYASSIATATASAVTDLQDGLADIFPVMAGLAVAVLIYRLILGRLKGR